MSALWVFAYGSLMWRPGFAHTDAVPARLRGARRALCIYSVIYRGTRTQPGLVFGLDCGGLCDGIAFHVPENRAVETRRVLHAREQVTNAYRAATQTVFLQADESRPVNALVFLANRAHPQYAGRLSPERQARIIRNAEGLTGRNLDYVLNTALKLKEFGVRDPELRRVLVHLGRHESHACEAKLA